MKSIKTIISLCIISSLFTLSFVGCTQPTTPESTNKKEQETVAPPTAEKVLETAKASLELPVIPKPENNVETVTLPATVEAKGKTVNVSWTIKEAVQDASLSENTLSITRNLADYTVQLQATLEYENKKVTKDLQKEIQKKNRFYWDDGTEHSITFDDATKEFKVCIAQYVYKFSYEKLNTVDKTFSAKLISSDGWGEEIMHENGQNIKYKYEIIKEKILIWKWNAEGLYKPEDSVVEDSSKMGGLLGL